jgi:hypothetical protein
MRKERRDIARGWKLTPELGKVEPIIPHAATQPGEGHSSAPKEAENHVR